MDQWIPQIFIIEIILSTISAFGRPDFNLPLFVFAYMVWDFPQPRPSVSQSQRTRVVYLMLFSLFVDFIYLIFWGSIWNSSLYQLYSNENTIHSIVIFVSVLVAIIKIGLIILIQQTDEMVKENMKVASITKNLMEFFSFNNITD